MEAYKWYNFMYKWMIKGELKQNFNIFAWTVTKINIFSYDFGAFDSQIFLYSALY